MSIVDIIKQVAEGTGAAFDYKRRYELNKSIDELSVPLIALFEIETPGFIFTKWGGSKRYYPVNIQFISQFEKDIDSMADQREAGREEAISMAERFLAALYKTGLFDDFPKTPGVIINKAYDVTALGYEINITLTPNEATGLC
jgi:hypothetical protein